MPDLNLFCSGRAAKNWKKKSQNFVRTSDNLMDDLPGTLGVFQTVYRRHKGLTLANVYAKNVCKLMIMAEVNSKVGAGKQNQKINIQGFMFYTRVI